MKASKDLDDYRKRINLLEMALFKSKSKVGMTRFDEIDERLSVMNLEICDFKEDMLGHLENFKKDINNKVF